MQCKPLLTSRRTGGGKESAWAKTGALKIENWSTRISKREHSHLAADDGGRCALKIKAQGGGTIK